MIIEKDIDIRKKPTEEQMKMLEATKHREVILDEDCPAQTEEELMQFRRIS